MSAYLEVLNCVFWTFLLTAFITLTVYFFILEVRKENRTQKALKEVEKEREEQKRSRESLIWSDCHWNLKKSNLPSVLKEEREDNDSN